MHNSVCNTYIFVFVQITELCEGTELVFPKCEGTEWFAGCRMATVLVCRIAASAPCMLIQVLPLVAEQ